MLRVLVTGGCGFIGSNFLRYLLENESDIEVLNYDVLTYAGNLANVKDLDSDRRYNFLMSDISDWQEANRAFEDFKPNIVIHFAAESHVDRSIRDSSVFVKTNVLGTQVLLELSRRHYIDRFVQISTDEVYGTLGENDEPWAEDSPIRPNSPYAASKAAAEMLAWSYYKTHGLDVIIVRSSNNFGPYQFPEKFIPVCIVKALLDMPIPIYGDGRNIRDWLYVEDNCSGIWLAAVKGKSGRVYNLAGECEKRNIEVSRSILKYLGKPETLFEYVKDRPGHDWRYAMHCNRAMSELGWVRKHDFETRLQATVQWYVNNQNWWKSLLKEK